MPRTPQFASTPRFVLSQRAPPSSFATRPRAESIDGDDSPQNTPLAKRVRRPVAAASTAASASGQTGTQRAAARDVIEDSEDGSELSNAEVDSELEAEYEALFGETERSKTKRRRVEEQNNRNGYEMEEDTEHYDHTLHDDNDNDNSPNQEEPTHPNDPSPSDPNPSSYSDDHIPSSPLKPPSTPYPNPHRRRFLLSTSSQLHTPSQLQSQSQSHSHLHPPSSTNQQAAHTTPSQSIPPLPPPLSTQPASRRKPGFVLPRSPSPETAGLDDISLLFSPSRTQRSRRGRPKAAAAQGYVAGGMAEQVRGWVLEMGVKGGISDRNGIGKKEGRGGLDGRRYAVVVRVEDAMGRGGEVVFVRGVEVRTEVEEQDEDEVKDGDENGERKLLLMGAPQSAEKDGVPELKKGDLIGIGWGLVWDVELDAEGESAGEMEKWSVCVEWDVL